MAIIIFLKGEKNNEEHLQAISDVIGCSDFKKEKNPEISLTVFSDTSAGFISKITSGFGM